MIIVPSKRLTALNWFRATIGGLGLTGIITWAELQLRPVPGPWMEVEAIRFSDLDEFFELSAHSDGQFEYTVAWIDAVGRGRRAGRGWFQRADHSKLTADARLPNEPRWSIPFVLPLSMVNPLSLRVFNCAYYHRFGLRTRRTFQRLDEFFFPLDRIGNWNRLYGPRGFHQYQCVVPGRTARDAIADLLQVIGRSGAGSFLTVLKSCGGRESQGFLSFPMQGMTLAVDFPYNPRQTEKLLSRLDSVVCEAGGRLYPAKDGRMPGSMFRAGYPNWFEIERRIDPKICSTFWRRVRQAASELQLKPLRTCGA